MQHICKAKNSFYKVFNDNNKMTEPYSLENNVAYYYFSVINKFGFVISHKWHLVIDNLWILLQFPPKDKEM